MAAADYGTDPNYDEYGNPINPWGSPQVDPNAQGGDGSSPYSSSPTAPNATTMPVPSGGGGTTGGRDTSNKDPKAAFQYGISQGMTGKNLTDWIQSQGISDNGLYYGDTGGQAGQFG